MWQLSKLPKVIQLGVGEAWVLTPVCLAPNSMPFLLYHRASTLYPYQLIAVNRVCQYLDGYN